ncbi:FAD-dependent monooxygenase [Streptomyces roseifaciens]
MGGTGRVRRPVPGAGDAARIHPPAGAQGMNTGNPDAPLTVTLREAQLLVGH